MQESVVQIILNTNDYNEPIRKGQRYILNGVNLLIVDIDKIEFSDENTISIEALVIINNENIEKKEESTCKIISLEGVK